MQIVIVMQDKELLDKIKSLPPDKIAEVADFVDFLSNKDDRLLMEAAAKISESSFAAVWDNAHDAEYDN